MQLISRIQIENFRSCRDVVLEGCAPFDAITGLNNSGKSNVLRALSLFFTDSLEPGVVLDVSSDYSGPARKKKQISVTLDFTFPGYFGNNARQKPMMRALGPTCQIRKTWTLDSARGHAEFVAEAKPAVQPEQIIDLVKFRFVPAHRDPAALLRSEDEGIQAEIARRYNASPGRRRAASGGFQEQLQDLAEVGREYIQDVSNEVSHQVKCIERIDMMLPTELRELISVIGYQVKLTDDLTLRELLQGSGVQSSMMFQILALSDTSFSKYFGNKQAVIWAVEEPECFLHTMLEADLVPC